MQALSLRYTSDLYSDYFHDGDTSNKVAATEYLMNLVCSQWEDTLFLIQEDHRRSKVSLTKEKRY